MSIMSNPDPHAALSAVETEQLRDLRSRLNRVPPSKAARRVLVAAFFKLCARVGLEPKADAPSNAVTIQLVINAAGDADLEQLRSLVSILAAMDREHPEETTAVVFAGGGQSVLSRRLVLAGKEQQKAPWSGA